jgi:glycogen phosphorylase
MTEPYVDLRAPLLPADVAGVEALIELALDLRWSWSHCADEVWRYLAPELWELTHNPWVVLQTVSRSTVERAMAEPDFAARVDDLLSQQRASNAAPAWFQQTQPDGALTRVAYFSLEFMLSEALPIYSGGLGNVAGDQLKAASDLGVPVVAVGLLYQLGYFRQVIDRSGAQLALFPYNDPGQLPIAPLRDASGEWLRLEIPLPGYSVWLRAWQVRVGRVRLYLLDSNDSANFPAYRGITGELYGGSSEVRLQQELLLGIGGWRLLQAVGLEPEVCHLNEGHAAFAVLERARSYMRAAGVDFDVAFAATRSGNLFTTHTAVPAGFDRFAPALIAQYLGRYAEDELGIGIDRLLGLGRLRADDAAEPFNPAYLAIRGSGAVNGVSRLHAHVSRQLFQPLFPRWPTAEVPVSHVTNGVHAPSWDSQAADALWTESCGKQRWLGTTESHEAQIAKLSDQQLWEFRAANARQLVTFARKRVARQLAASGAAAQAVADAAQMLDPNALTLGFARRFAAYKRPNLLLHDPDRLLRLLLQRERPVQLLIAGKAHPADADGQRSIKQWLDFIRHTPARAHVVFLADYDMLLTESLVQGVDVWINTPRRPWEACGTSGMKTLVNGGLNLSVLDGWWAEAYAPDVGWALGDAHEQTSEPLQDATDAVALYELLENAVIPEFYQRDEDGIPRAWLARMRASMARLTAQFSANRSVREYTETHYLPAARRYRARTANEAAEAKQIVAWQRRLRQHYHQLHFGDVVYRDDAGQTRVEVQVYLDELEPDDVRVQLFADAREDDADRARIVDMQRVRALPGSVGGYTYSGATPADRPAADFTVRVIPARDGAVVPLEAGEILWQR